MSTGPIIAATAPLGWCLAAFAVYAIVAIPLVFWGLGRTGKRGVAWLVLPGLAAVAAVGLWLYVHDQVVV